MVLLQRGVDRERAPQLGGHFVYHIVVAADDAAADAAVSLGRPDE